MPIFSAFLMGIILTIITYDEGDEDDDDEAEGRRLISSTMNDIVETIRQLVRFKGFSRN